jgi:hypothetical protein
MLLNTSETFGEYYTLCDGRPRVRPNGTVSFNVEFTPTTYLLSSPETSVYTTSDPPSFERCEIVNSADCEALQSLYNDFEASSKASWSAENVYTLSLASPPTLLVVNGKTRALSALSNGAPPIIIRQSFYSTLPRRGTTYFISDATNLVGEPWLRPGDQITVMWEPYDQWRNRIKVNHPVCSFLPNATTYSTSTCVQTHCTIDGDHAELLYFAPPETSRDLCANTALDYDRCLFPNYYTLCAIV